MTSPSKYFKWAAALPFVTAVILGGALDLMHRGNAYKSEWSTDDGFGLTIILTILLSALIALLSLTLLLNKITTVKDNFFLSLVSWLLLPGSICTFVICEEVLNFTGQSNVHGTYEGNRLLDGYIMCVGIVHLLFLILGFIHYRLRLKG